MPRNLVSQGAQGKMARAPGDSRDDWTWLYLLGGYVLGVLVGRLLSERDVLGGRALSFIGGLGLGLTGRSLGRPWRH